MITYHVELLADCLNEIEAYLQAHFEEVATKKNNLGAPNMDVGAYCSMEISGQLHIVTARSNGSVIGYHVSFVRPHLHYKHILTAITDVYYVAPEYRKGNIAIKLFQEAERTLKARGVKRLFSGTKKHKDMSKIFEFMGWEEVEILHSKWIGG